MRPTQNTKTKQTNTYQASQICNKSIFTFHYCFFLPFLLFFFPSFFLSFRPERTNKKRTSHRCIRAQPRRNCFSECCAVLQAGRVRNKLQRSVVTQAGLPCEIGFSPGGGLLCCRLAGRVAILEGGHAMGEAGFVGVGFHRGRANLFLWGGALQCRRLSA